MKRSLPLYGAGRRALCAAGLACALSSGLACLPALAEPVTQTDSTSQQVSADTVSSSQLAELSDAAGQSTASLVRQIEDSLSQQGIAASYADSGESILPVMPYIFGAASALVGVGVFAGGFALLHKHRKQHEGEDVQPHIPAEPSFFEHLHDERQTSAAHQPVDSASASCSAGVLGNSPDDTAAFIAVAGRMSPTQACQSILSDSTGEFTAVHTPAMPCAGRSGSFDDIDELESLAMGYAASCASVVVPAHAASSPHPDDFDDGPDGGPGHGAPFAEPAPAAHAAPAREAYARTDLTMPLDCVGKQADDASDFVATARVLATGAGEVHRVNTPSSHLAFSGMDIVDVAATFHHDEPAADPMVSHDDWRAVALGEFREKPTGPSKPESDLSTDDYMALIATKAQPASCAKHLDYVAPVIGPGLDREAATRRQELMRASDSPAAALLVDRDEEFLASRARTHGEASVPSEASSPARFASSSSVQSTVPTSGRPGPAAHGSSVFQRAAVDLQSKGVPCASAFVPPRSPASTSVVSDRGLAAAIAAASSAYAAFNSYTTMTIAPVSATDVPAAKQERADRAASYAAAVYGSIEQPGSGSAQSVRAMREAVPASAAHHNPADYALPLSEAYIDHMVQDEFDHRHDSPAQRNAALGRMQVINGSAVSPVSVRESMRRNRA